MDDQNLKSLAEMARKLYDIMSIMQRLMLNMFFEEFCDLDEEEQRKAFLEAESINL